MGNLDQALKDADSAMFNPPHIEVTHYTHKQLELMTADVTDMKLKDHSLLTDMIYGDVPHNGRDIALSPGQAHRLGWLLSNVLTCPRADLDEHIENLRELFAENMKPMARDIAIELLESGEEL